VQSALPVGDGFCRVCRATVAASVRGDEAVFPQEFIAAGINPILVATAATVQQEERISGAVCFVIKLNPVNLQSVPCVLGWHMRRMEQPRVLASFPGGTAEKEDTTARNQDG